jgi:hypothetical protein
VNYDDGLGDEWLRICTSQSPLFPDWKSPARAGNRANAIHSIILPPHPPTRWLFAAIVVCFVVFVSLKYNKNNNKRLRLAAQNMEGKLWQWKGGGWVALNGME